MTTLKVRKHPNVTIIEAPEQFTTHRTEKQLLPSIARSVIQESPNFVLDLSHCSFMDSAAIGTILSCWDFCRNNGGALKLLGPLPARTARFLRTTRLNEVLEVFDNEKAAVDSF